MMEDVLITLDRCLERREQTAEGNAVNVLEALRDLHRSMHQLNDSMENYNAVFEDMQLFDALRVSLGCLRSELEKRCVLQHTRVRRRVGRPPRYPPGEESAFERGFSQMRF